MNGKKIRFVILSLVLVVSLLSCATGQYMGMKSGEDTKVLGIIRTTFDITGAFRYRKAINSQAYMNLLAEAQKEYAEHNGVIDVRDITWAVGKSDAANNNYEYTAIGKVISY